jgi:hypothetical protein
MSAPKCTDEEFIKLWREHGSPHAVARALSLEVTNVYRRRRRIETRHGIELNANMHTDKTVVKRHDARVEHSFENGIVIVFSDAHFWPRTYTTAFRALLKFIENMKPKVVVCNGDAFDGASISRHPPIGWDELPTVQEELEAVEDHLTQIEDAHPKARFFWPLGNHDARYETRLAVNVPEFRGVERFHLKDHFPKWTPCWSAWINDTVFKHRFKGGIHSAWNNTIWAGRNIVTGHDHQLWHRAFRDYNGIRYGIDTGLLADVDGEQFIDYTEGNPKAWNSGFFVLTYSGGILLQPESVIVVDEGMVEFRGERQEVK